MHFDSPPELLGSIIGSAKWLAPRFICRLYGIAKGYARCALLELWITSFELYQVNIDRTRSPDLEWFGYYTEQARPVGTGAAVRCSKLKKGS
jgi:hypothetical protein